MKVRDLIARLLECDQEAEVCLISDAGETSVAEKVEEGWAAVPGKLRGRLAGSEIDWIEFRTERETYLPPRFTQTGPQRAAVRIE